MMIVDSKNIGFDMFSFKNVPIILYLFLFVFAPFIFPFSNVIHVLALIAYYFLLRYFYSKSLRLLKSKSLFYFVLIQVGLFFFAFLHYLFVPDFGNIYSLYLIVFEILPICFFITFYLSKLNISYVDFLNLILLVGIIQFIFVLGALLSPVFRDLTMIYFPKGSGFDDYFSILREYRMFGFTRNYTFGMPLFMGLCLIISFVLGNFVTRKYFVLIPFYIFSIAVNARIGLIALPIVIGVLFFYKIRYNFFSQIFGMMIIGFLIIGTILFIEMKDEESTEYSAWTWLNDGVKEMSSFSKGEKTGNMEALAGSMWVFPSPEYMLLGTGKNIFQSKNNQKSDIGLILDFYYGGIFFCYLLYYSYCKLLLVYDKKDLIQKCLFISMLLFLFLANFKGLVFSPHELLNGILLVSVFTIFFNKTSKLKKV
jgi:hypothetical protein